MVTASNHQRLPQWDPPLANGMARCWYRDTYASNARAIRRKARIADAAHNCATDALTRRSLILGSLAAILSATVSAGVFTTLQGNRAAVGLRIAAAATAAVAAILVALQTYSKYGSRAEGHRRSSRAYDQLVHDIDKRLALATSTLTPDDMNHVCAEFAKIANAAPNVPPHIWCWAFWAVEIEDQSWGYLDAAIVPRGRFLWAWRLKRLVNRRGRAVAAVREMSARPEETRRKTAR
jgi:hypothetical protein